MRKLILPLVLITGFALWSQPPSGALVNQSIGRVGFGPDGSAQLYGYFTFLEGFDLPLFNGVTSERTAHFTYRSQPSGLDYITNGSLMHLFGVPRQSSPTTVGIYFDANPNQDFEKPETFSDGQLVATYETRGTRATIIPASTWSASTMMLRQTAAEVSVGNRTLAVPGRLIITLSGLSLPSFDQFLIARSAGGLTIPYGSSGTLSRNQ